MLGRYIITTYMELNLCTVVALYCFVTCGCFGNMWYVYCHSSATLTEGFPCFFFSCKANAGVKLAKIGHGPHSSKLVVICVVLLLFMLFYVLFVFVLFYVLFVFKCVLYYCHRVATQLQLTYHIIPYHIKNIILKKCKAIGYLAGVK